MFGGDLPVLDHIVTSKAKGAGDCSYKLYWRDHKVIINNYKSHEKAEVPQSDIGQYCYGMIDAMNLKQFFIKVMLLLNLD